MLHSHHVAILLAVLPAFTTATPWYKRMTASSSIIDNASSTSETAPSVTTEGYTTASSVVSSSSSTEAYDSSSVTSETAYTSSSDSASASGSASDVYGSSMSESTMASASASASATQLAPTPALCGADMQPTVKAQAMVFTTKDVIFEWGPDRKIISGQTAPFVWPLYCSYTNFTVYVFEEDTLATLTGTDEDKKAKARETHSCAVIGGSVDTEIPVMVINVQSVAPFFSIVDIGLDPYLTFPQDGQCGDVKKVTGSGAACGIESSPELNPGDQTSAVPSATGGAYGQDETSSQATSSSSSSSSSASGSEFDASSSSSDASSSSQPGDSTSSSASASSASDASTTSSQGNVVNETGASSSVSDATAIAGGAEETTSSDPSSTQASSTGASTSEPSSTGPSSTDSSSSSSTTSDSSSSSSTSSSESSTITSSASSSMGSCTSFRVIAGTITEDGQSSGRSCYPDVATDAASTSST